MWEKMKKIHTPTIISSPLTVGSYKNQTQVSILQTFALTYPSVWTTFKFANRRHDAFTGRERHVGILLQSCLRGVDTAPVAHGLVYTCWVCRFFLFEKRGPN